MRYRVAVAFLAIFVAGTAWAQGNFPSKPITTVVGR